MAHANVHGDDVEDTVRCNDSEKEASIFNCYCMTYNKSSGPVVACFYSFLHPKLKEQLYYLLPLDVTELNKYILCGYLDREGQLCGKMQKI